MSSPIKSIQRGVKSASNNDAAVTVNINTIDPNKSFVILNLYHTSGSTSSSIKLDKLESNSFTATAHCNSSGSFSWQVIEFA